MVGYTQTSLTCDNSVGQVTKVTLALGENVTCTFVNDDIAPKLTLVKTVINDNGGTAVRRPMDAHRQPATTPAITRRRHLQPVRIGRPRRLHPDIAHLHQLGRPGHQGHARPRRGGHLHLRQRRPAGQDRRRQEREACTGDLRFHDDDKRRRQCDPARLRRVLADRCDNQRRQQEHPDVGRRHLHGQGDNPTRVDPHRHRRVD